MNKTRLNKAVSIGLPAIFVLSVLSTAFLSFRVALSQYFHLDEWEEADIGWKITKIGAKAFHPVPEGGMPVSHPLLYSFSHALVQKIFGHSEFVLRMYGVFHYLLCLSLVLLIVKEIVQEKGPVRNFAIFIAATLYLLNPLLVQHSVVINADNNILTTFLLLFVYFFLRYENKPQAYYLGSRWKLAVLLALCWWTKEFAPLFVLSGILFYRLINKEWRKLLIDALLVGVLGLAIFWFTWWVFCKLTGVDVWGFVKFTIINKSRRAFTLNYLKGIHEMIFYGFRWNLYWVSAPFFIALGLFAVNRLRDLKKLGRVSLVDGLFIIAATAWIPFQFFRPTIDMVKYQYPAYPLFIAVIAWSAAKAFKQKTVTGIFSPSNNKRNLIILVIIAVLVFHYFLLGDYLNVLWKPLYKHLNGHFLIYYYLPLFAAGSLAVLVSRRGGIMVNLILIFTLCVIPINAALALNQARADYLTFEVWLNYGEAGMRRTVDYLRENVRPNSVISVRADIRYYLRDRYGVKFKDDITPDNFFLTSDEAMIDVIMANVPIEFLVIDKISASQRMNKGVFGLIDKHFMLDKHFGDFIIFKRRI